jgi:hypothetical protein
VRQVDILPVLRDELVSHRHACADATSNDLVFPTSTGSRRDKDNVRERVICPVVKHADELRRRPFVRQHLDARVAVGQPLEHVLLATLLPLGLHCESLASARLQHPRDPGWEPLCLQRRRLLIEELGGGRDVEARLEPVPAEGGVAPLAVELV